MPELFAVIATLLTIVVALVLLYFAVALWGVALVGVAIAGAFIVRFFRMLGAWMCGDDENEEAA